MSRNLCRTGCPCCDGQPVLTETPRPIREDEAGAYYHEYQGMMVAEAECPDCHAKYLAWVTGHVHCDRMRWAAQGLPYVDLSYRSTFNDEPGPEDLPTHDVIRVSKPKKP